MFFKYASPRRFVRICLALAIALLVNGSLGWATAAATPPAAADPVSDFHISFRSDADDTQKYLSFGWNGWSGHVVHWRYNDVNRPPALVPSASAAVARIQSAMSKWTSVCNVQFVYDGTTTISASLSTAARDGLNVITWSELPGSTTGITYAGASGLGGSTFTIDEADMLINSQFNPDLDSTFAHEVGHMLGLKHSNKEAAVMSGPNIAPDPSTAYTSLSALQADDIAGCQSLYGAASGMLSAPVASASVAAIAFADTALGSVSSAQSVTVTNASSVALVISSGTVSGSDFALVSTTCNAGTTVAPGASCVATVRFAPAAIGTRTGNLHIAHNAQPPSTTVALSGNGRAAATTITREMVEYWYAPLDYYFITSRDAEKSALDATSGWARTGSAFLVYAAAQAGTRSVTRFYFDRVARSAGRGSHFYTLFDSDVAALASQNPTQSTAPGFAQNEGVDSFAFLPVVAGGGGFCDNSSLPVYRLFRGPVRFPDDPNHRFTTSVAVYNDFVARGWTGEGVNFCVPAS